MIFTLLKWSIFFTATLASTLASTQDVVWTSSGGGWRAMVAASAYAQVFSKLGILGGNDEAQPQIKVMAGSSGATWFLSQFSFSENYYNAVINGNATSLGQFTRAWMDAYATTQAISADCGYFQELCDKATSAGPAVEDVAALIPLAVNYNHSWAEIIYAMYDATSNMVYNDPNMVSVKASSSEKNAGLSGVDVCFHVSLLPNARVLDVDTITYLAKDHTNVSSSYTVPIPYDYCVGDNSKEWLPESWPGGNVYNLNKNASFVDSKIAKGFPMFTPNESDDLYVTPQHDKDTDNAIVNISPAEMSIPFGDDPTSLQISVASSSTVGYISGSYFAQFFSIVEYEIQHNSDLSAIQKVTLKALVKKFRELSWSTGFLAGFATMSGWTEPNPATMPPATELNYWFADGGYTDGPAAAHAIARYQQLYGTSTPIKLIICNQNYYTNNNNNIIDYFSFSGNEGVAPGAFIWPMGVGAGPQLVPQMSKQIFGEAMSMEELNGLFEPVGGTNLTMAVLPVTTTVDNEPFGVKAGQEVSIAVINLNSNSPTFIVTEEVIQAKTPGLVSMAESIASSQDLVDKVAAFVGTSATTVSGTNGEVSMDPTPPSNEVTDPAEPEVVLLDEVSSSPLVSAGQSTIDSPSSATTTWKSMTPLIPLTCLVVVLSLFN